VILSVQLESYHLPLTPSYQSWRHGHGHHARAIDKSNQTFPTLNPGLYAHPFEAISLRLASEYRKGDGSALILAPSCYHHVVLSDNRFSLVIWPISHNPLVFEYSSSLPCRTIKSRRARHWPATHSPKNSRIATRPSLLPHCFKSKHEHSPNSEGVMAKS